MQTKLHINIHQGIIDVEGDVDLVREVYTDFKDRLTSQFGGMAINQSDNNTDGIPSSSRKPRPTAKKKANLKTTSNPSDIDANSPKLDKDLNTSGLVNFCDQYIIKSHAEKILVFLKFIVEELGIDKPNTDQVFSCYKHYKVKVPTAFAQAFRDTSSKQGYINYISAEDITITTLGDNFYDFDLPKKTPE